MLFTLALIALHGGCVGTPMDFALDYTETWTETLERAVGPSDESGVRGTLPQPAPDDTNSIWLAPNGSDANAGTQALPKLTLAAAVAALTGTATNVQIFRNGYVGELVFTGGTVTLPTARSIQVEEGEWARLELTSLVVQGTSVVNGIWVASDADAGLWLQGAGTASNVLVTNSARSKLRNIAMSTSPTIEYSVFAFVYHLNAGGGGLTVTVNNCLIVGPGTGETLGVGGVLYMPTLTATGTATFTVDFYRCTLRTNTLTSTDTLINANIPDNLDLTLNISFDSCDILAGRFVTAAIDTATASLTVNATLDFTKNGAGTGTSLSSGDGTLSANFTITDPIAANQSSQLIDENAGYAATEYDIDWARYFRLRREGGLTPDESDRYTADSPLVGAGTGGEDVNPWDESITFASRGWSGARQITLPAKTVRVEHIPINPAEVDSLAGSGDRDFDAFAREWVFEWQDAAQTDVHGTILALMSDRSTLLVYPAGSDGNLISELFDGGESFGDWDSSAKTLTLALAYPFVAEHWKGMLVEIEYAVSSYRTYIVTDVVVPLFSSPYFVLENPFPEQPDAPSDSAATFLVRSFWGYVKPETVVRSNDLFTSGFRKGSKFVEAPETHDARQWKGAAMRLRQTLYPRPAPLT